MRRVIPILVLAAMAGRATAVEIQVTSFPPGQMLGPGVSAMVTVSGLAPNQEATWLRIPQLEGDTILKLQDEHNQPVLLFGGTEPGTRTLLLILARPGLDEIFQRDFEYGSHDPRPPPDPPDPDPTPPVAKWQVVVFHQSDRLDNAPQAQRDMISGRQFRDELVAAGHTFVGGFDVDALASSGQTTCTPQGCSTTTLPATLKPWWDAVAGHDMPALAIAPKGGGAIRVFPLPADSQALFRLLEDQR